MSGPSHSRPTGIGTSRGSSSPPKIKMGFAPPPRVASNQDSSTRVKCKPYVVVADYNIQQTGSHRLGQLYSAIVTLLLKRGDWKLEVVQRPELGNGRLGPFLFPPRVDLILGNLKKLAKFRKKNCAAKIFLEVGPGINSNAIPTPRSSARLSAQPENLVRSKASPPPRQPCQPRLPRPKNLR